jgi:hypothetical protein
MYAFMINGVCMLFLAAVGMLGALYKVSAPRGRCATQCTFDVDAFAPLWCYAENSFAVPLLRDDSAV